MQSESFSADRIARFPGPTSELAAWATSVATATEGAHSWEKPLDHLAVLLQDSRKRRKITTTKTLSRNYLLHRGNQRVGGLSGNYTSLVSEQARRTCLFRGMTRKYLAASDVPIPPGREFSVHKRDEALEYLTSQGSAGIIRPADTAARGMSTFGVNADPESFDAAWEAASSGPPAQLPAEQQILVECTDSPLFLRIYAVSESSVAALLRIPFFVIGDGKRPVAELIRRERQRREGCAYASANLPSEKSQMDSSSTPLDRVLDDQEVCFLSSSPDSLRQGTLSIDVRDHIDDSLAELALNAMWAMPGLAASAVDLVTPSLSSAEGAAVVGVDPAGDVSEFLYPAMGRPRQVGLRVIDHMLALSSQHRPGASR